MLFQACYEFVPGYYLIPLNYKRRELLGYVKYPILIIGGANIPDNKVFLNVYVHMYIVSLYSPRKLKHSFFVPDGHDMKVEINSCWLSDNPNERY